MPLPLVALAAVLCFAGAEAGLGAAPAGCRWRRDLRPPNGDVSVSLECAIRTAASANVVLAQLGPTQIGKVDALRFSCGDPLLFESSLRLDAAVEPLGRRLRALRIDNCRIRYVPAGAFAPLKDLVELALRSDFDDRSAAVTTELHADTFRDLGELRALDLGGNSVWRLPAEVFCPLYTLKTLNLTLNRLQDISEIGFSDWGKGPTAPGKSCNTGLVSLDVSHNSIAALPDNGLSSLRSLEFLDLRSNVIAQLGDRAFVGLSSLGVLNMCDNKLSDLPPELFQYTRHVTQILISNNRIRSLGPGVLQGLDRLQILDLSRNELTHSFINRDTFAGLVRLEVLNLSSNKLTRIDSKVFQDLKSLHELYVENNAIDYINGGVFGDLKELRVLSLSQNRLKSVDEVLFSNLYVLNVLYLDDNAIEFIHSRSFENVTNLQTLGLSGNRLKGIPESVRRLRVLKYLDIGKNEIEKIDGSSFDGLQELYGLRMVDNKIVNISKDVFTSLPSLQLLNLASNTIENIEPGTFDTNNILKLIKLDGNRLWNIAGVFDKLQSLGWLNISDNRITHIDYAYFSSSLEFLDVHKNNITRIENVFKVSSDNMLYVDASFNFLTQVNNSSIPDGVETMLLNNNRITSIAPNTFSTKHNLKKVSMFGNLMTAADRTAFMLPPVPEHRDLPQFHIGGNPFVCDCSMDWVQRLNQWNNLRQYPRFMDLESVTCRTVRGFDAPRPLLELPNSQFLCPYKSHCSSHCNCCDYQACDCKMTCPEGCSCYHDASWSSNVIDCSRGNHTEIPKKIPMDATEIYLDGNNLGALGNHLFIGKKKLSVLYLNNSNVASIENGTFNGLYSLRTLNLGQNHITEIRGNELNQTKNLKELYLDHNAITYVDNNTFASMPSLKVLRLDYNKIHDLNPKSLSGPTTPNLLEVYVEGNIWSCDCDTIDDIERWSKGTRENVKMMFCANESEDFSVAEAAAKCRGQMRNEVDPPTENQPSAYKEPDVPEMNYVPLISIILIAVILICLLGALMFAFMQDVRLWAHSKYGVRIFKHGSIAESELDKDRMYDGYVVYSVLDDDFVTRVVSPELEQSGYSMCLHYRDLQISSDNYLSETLVNATEASKRLILVISFSFLQNEWSRPTFKRSLKNTIESIPASLRRHKVVFVLTTDVSALNLDADLQSFFKICTVIFWGEKRFWEKIRYAMPDIANLQWNKSSPSKANGGQMGVVGARRSVTRYTAGPTSLDQWYKYAALPPQPMLASTIPTPGDDSSLLTSTTLASQAYDGDPLNHSYVSIDTHVYERSRRDPRSAGLDEQGYLRPRPAPPHMIC